MKAGVSVVREVKVFAEIRLDYGCESEKNCSGQMKSSGSVRETLGAKGAARKRN